METPTKANLLSTDNLKKVFFLISIGFSVLMFLQNYYINRQLDVLQHRADVREAYFNKGLIDGAKDREKAYNNMRSNLEQILKHCETAKCNLPLNLAVIPEEAKFDSLEMILTRNKE